MSLAISSAIPSSLQRYSIVASQLDAELLSESGRLAGILQHFEATCREPGYAVRVSYLADELRYYAQQAEPLDRWVGLVGIGFLSADTSRGLVQLTEAAIGVILIKSAFVSNRHLKISLAWVKLFHLKPSAVRTFLGITARRIRFQNLLKYHDKVIGKAALLLGIVLKWAEDFQTYSGAELISAMIVDTALIVVGTKIAVGIGMGLLALGLSPTIILLAVIATPFLLDFVVEKFDIRDRAINALNVAIKWTRDLGSKVVDFSTKIARNLDDNLFKPIAKTIAGGIDNLKEFVDSAAKRLRQKMKDAMEAAGRILRDEAIKPTVGEAVALRRSLHEAMDGWGTNEAKVFALLAQASEAEKQAVRNDPYLMTRLRRELSGSDFEKVLNLLQPAVCVPPQTPLQIPQQRDEPGKLGKNLLDTINTLNPETNDRYRPNRLGKGETYCNLYVMDVAKSLNVPLFGEAAKYGSPEAVDWNSDGIIDDYMDANEMVAWLQGTYQHPRMAVDHQGPSQGWQMVSKTEAAKLAAEGYFVVVGWYNPNGIGHVAVVRPDSTPENIRIAQAGRENFSNGSLERAGWPLSELMYFVYRPPSPAKAEKQG
ncbi:MAG: hypothetical protein QXS54_02535 [Candidatus Methanomethylicaceae archaeon]